MRYAWRLLIALCLPLLIVCISAGIVKSASLTRLASESTSTSSELWEHTSLNGAPVGRYGHTAIWTGSEMLIWGGYFHAGNFLSDGAHYNPATNVWTPITTTKAPVGRLRHTAIWTGQEMIVWGGESGGGGATTNSGGRYSPTTDTWTPITTTDAPTSREMHSAVWTGSEMIVWGGCSTIFCSQGFNDGGRYNPANDTWTPITGTASLPARNAHQALWTGNSMIVWGGTTDPEGSSFDPDTNTWKPITTTNAPTSTFWSAGVWTGEEMIVWGGCTVFLTSPCTSYVQSGARYRPTTDTWIPITTTNAPAARWTHTAIWTGVEFIVWGGCGAGCYNTGGRYDPATKVWTATSITNAPSPRSFHRAVWTGGAMIVWGGCNIPGCGGATYYNTGGEYTSPLYRLYLPMMLKQ